MAEPLELACLGWNPLAHCHGTSESHSLLWTLVSSSRSHTVIRMGQWPQIPEGRSGTQHMLHAGLYYWNKCWTLSQRIQVQPQLRHQPSTWTPALGLPVPHWENKRLKSRLLQKASHFPSDPVSAGHLTVCSVEKCLKADASHKNVIHIPVEISSSGMGLSLFDLKGRIPGNTTGEHRQDRWASRRGGTEKGRG